MTAIHAYRHGVIVPSTELAHAPQLVTRFATAPDGLPWLIQVDRSNELQTLFRAVCSVFGVADAEQLPSAVRGAVEDHLARGLMGVHEIDLEGSKRAVYVSRRTARELLGPSLLVQLLAHDASSRPGRGPGFGGPPQPPAHAYDDDESMAVSAVMAIAAASGNEELSAAVERSIEERRSTRRLLIEVASGRPLSGAVSDEGRVLRLPRGPYRPLLEERLEALGEVVAVIHGSGGVERTRVSKRRAFMKALHRARLDSYGGRLEFEVPRSGVLAGLAGLAEALAKLHDRGLVHGDISPGNVLFCSERPTIFDSLDVPVGTPATTATFSWAAPEQIIGLPVSPSTDVFALAKLATRLIGGVPFGEQTHYVVPTGGSSSRTVELLKCEGVFVDVTDSDHGRAWQVAWQDFLAKGLAYRSAQRVEDARSFAQGLRALLKSHPPSGALRLPGDFGQLVSIEGGGKLDIARLSRD